MGQERERQLDKKRRKKWRIGKERETDRRKEWMRETEKEGERKKKGKRETKSEALQNPLIFSTLHTTPYQARIYIL